MSRVAFIAFLAAPIVMAFLASVEPPERAAEWIGWAKWAPPSVLAYSLGSMLLIDRSFRSASTQESASPKEPARTLLMLGVVSAIAPSGVALVVSRFGLPLPHMYAIAAISLAGVAVCGARYGEAIGARTSGDSPAA